MSAGMQTGEIGKTAWLSQGLEELLQSAQRDFDVIIVGSGYGGAIAAAELAGCKRDGADGPISVCVLERGREYLSGMFPSRLAELPMHVRFSTPGNAEPRGRRDGLFDIRLGEHVSAVLANGLGGGSLINAGVMEEPRDDVLRRFPDGVGDDLRQTYFAEARKRLGANHRTIEDHPAGRPPKLDAFMQLAPRAGPANISIGVKDEKNEAGVHLHECKRCGDCATGCNHGSKNSLDVNLLASAEAAGAKIFTGATVLGITPDSGKWLVHAVHTDEALRKRQGKPATLRARHLILAAGTFGSTELLKRARAGGLRVSRCVGRKFSTNGDAIAAIYDHRAEANAIAEESQRVEARNIGPTITGMLDLRPGCVIQEIAIPGPMRRVFEETITTSKMLHELGGLDCAWHRADRPGQDPCAVDASAIRRTSVFVMMGNDGAEGVLKLVRRNPDAGDGAIAVKWKGIKKHALFGKQIEALQKLAEKGGKKARVLPNPLWQLLPASMQFLIDDERGPALTVHPLGGCAMASRPADGVVNDLGQVFDSSDPRGETVLPGLAVLDGSIVPSALGINPALTIAALALRAVEGLRGKWRLGEPPRPKAKEPNRPLFRPSLPPVPARPTEIEIVERMAGEAKLRTRDGGELACVVELTLRFEKQGIAALFLPRGLAPVPMKRSLRVSEGELRIFRKAQWDAWRRRGEPEERLAAIAEVRAPLKGTLELLHREPSISLWRVGRALWAWLWNRGLRDIWQSFFPAVKKRKRKTIWEVLVAIPTRVRGVIALASRAGEVRLLEYCLPLAAKPWCRKGTPIDTKGLHAEAATIRGVKRLTYSRRSNPWRQLMRMHVRKLPGLAFGKPALDLDPKYLASQGVPLFKVVGQNDQVAALADVISFLGYFLRLLLNIHMWSFRRPDPPKARKLQQLPPEREIKGRLPRAVVDWIDVPQPNGKVVVIKLTGYLQDPVKRQPTPVLMIHGYSASGTTFAHHAVKPNMAEYFFRKGRDVWIVDMRTSSGMPTATEPWKFEQAALEDIPMAVEAICTTHRATSVDVFAHCMGSAMFSMAVLGDADPNSLHRAAHAALRGRIRHVVLSQIAPVMVMSPANIFRGYAMRYLRHFLPLQGYKFRVSEAPELAEQLTDRLLATLPYPEKEFDVENPPYRFWRRTPFAGTRHRMDALYGQDFSIADERRKPLLDDAVLEYIDDLFGPLSIETVAQTIHFARSEVITNQDGRNKYVQPIRIRERWTFPTMSIHGEDNGLSDVATLHRFQRRFRDDADTVIRTHAFPGFGHQDGLIGKNAQQVFDVVYRFLQDPNARQAP
ncbi:MAG TPA: alpha/beta fold hydrolase [Burkholderiales bacterium]|nr:alpha/beta fold hydrolase [Burkholderiales bacterium]